MPDLEATLDPNSLTAFELIAAGVIVVVANLVARWLRRSVRKRLTRYEGLDENVSRLLGRVAGWMTVFVGILLALSVLGLDIGGVVLVFVFAVALMALAGKGILENFAAGVLLQIRAPFHVGDRIETKGYRGTVEQINGHTVVIETDDHRTVHVPNREVMADPIVSYTDMPIRRSKVEVDVAYDTDTAAAQALLIDTAAGVEGVRSDRTPRAFIREFADSGIGITVHFWHDDGQRIEVRGRVAEAVKQALEGAGIEIPFPQRVVTFENSPG